MSRRLARIPDPPDDGTILDSFDDTLPRGGLDDVGELVDIEVIEHDLSSKQSLVRVTLQKWVSW